MFLLPCITGVVIFFLGFDFSIEFCKICIGKNFEVGVCNNMSIPVKDNSFDQVIKRFPDSKYAKDSRQKIILVKSNVAAKHMEIGRFYLENKKYFAALNRFKIVVDEFSITKFTPEALHRMVEAYYEMGMYEDSYNTAALLGYNYPESKWYKYSYNLVGQNDNEETFLKKIRNFFDG